jgi:hypothetical protein
MIDAVLIAVVAQVVTENAGTVSPETPIWQSRLEMTRSAHVTDLRAVETLLWAPDGATDVALGVPVHHRDVELGGVSSTLEGVGDVSLRVKRSLWKEDGVMASARFSALAGTRLPTGEFREVEGAVGVPRKLQLGAGGVELFGGPLFTWIEDRHRFAAEVVGRWVSERDDFQPQPSLQVGLAYWFRLTPARIETAGEQTEVRVVLELTTVFYGESELDGDGIGDDGNITWLSPGVQVYPSFWALFEASVQVPVVETVEDARGDRKFGLLVSIKFLF